MKTLLLFAILSLVPAILLVFYFYFAGASSRGKKPWGPIKVSFLPPQKATGFRSYSPPGIAISSIDEFVNPMSHTNKDVSIRKTTEALEIHLNKVTEYHNFVNGNKKKYPASRFIKLPESLDRPILIKIINGQKQAAYRVAFNNKFEIEKICEPDFIQGVNVRDGSNA